MCAAHDVRSDEGRAVIRKAGGWKSGLETEPPSQGSLQLVTLIVSVILVEANMLESPKHTWRPKMICTIITALQLH